MNRRIKFYFCLCCSCICIQKLFAQKDPNWIPAYCNHNPKSYFKWLGKRPVQIESNILITTLMDAEKNSTANLRFLKSIGTSWGKSSSLIILPVLKPSFILIIYRWLKDVDYKESLTKLYKIRRFLKGIVLCNCIIKIKSINY